MVDEKMKKEFCKLRDEIIKQQYKNLNDQQVEAVLTTEGPVLILAGAGSGKTSVLVNRISNLLNFGLVYNSNYVPDDLTKDDIDLMKNWLNEDELKQPQDKGLRVAQLIRTRAVYSSQILAITFTNKAAEEMRERVRSFVGNEVDNMWISTFHSSCVRILRREIDKIGYNKNFAIYDSYDQKTLIKQCMDELDINDKNISHREIISKISRQKDNLISAKEYKRLNENNFKLNKIADVYLLYQKKLKDNNALDFDDLIYKTIELLKKDKDVLDFYQRKFKYIMVDEYQDTNKAQYELIRLLASSHNNLCVVGDDDQCIYAWRGADIRNILDFEKDYPDAKVIKLEQNYRSKGNILKAANEVIKNNDERKSKVLRTSSEDGEKIKIYRAFSDRDEADFVANEIKDIIKKENKKYKDFAVLYRTNAQSRIFEDSFIKNDIPYRIVGGLKFYDRREIKDIISYLKIINNPLDDISLKRVINVPKRGIGDVTISKVEEYANYMDECLYSVLLDVNNINTLNSRNISSISKFTSLINSFIKIKDEVSVSKLIEEILNQTGYLKELEESGDLEDLTRIENLQELVSAAVDFENTSDDKSLSAFLEKITLISDIDNFDSDLDTVVMMTVHSAKGLEFPVVFMVGMENGIFPGNQSLNDYKEMQESRRLCYVGITRAKDKLYMTSAEVRRVFGKTVSLSESEFIDEITPLLKENISLNKSRPKNDYRNNKRNNPFSMKNNSKFMGNSKKQSIQNNNLKRLTKDNAVEGAKVKHATFGNGTIVSVSETEGNVKLTIVFDNMGVKKLMLDVAPLEVI